MRIHLLTALVLVAVPTASHAQDTISAPPSTALVTVAPAGGTQIESPPESPNAIELVAPAQDNQSLPIFFSPGAGAAADAVGPLIVFDQQDPKALDEMAEDFNIFGFILKRNLEKALGEQMPEIKMGVPMLLESGGRHIHASYIEGFGALFNLRVAVPILAPPASEAKRENPKEPSEWDKARAALYGGETAQAQWSRASMRTVEHYDAKVVETLKKQVLESLKSAGNLRRIKPDEWIVVTITGSPNGPDTQVGTASADGLSSYSAGGAGTRAWRRSGRPTVMTFRVKKSTVEALAAKSSSEEQFAGKVEVTAYLGAEAAPGAGGGGSGSSGAMGGSGTFGVTPQPR
jgi:hypothetical protein